VREKAPIQLSHPVIAVTGAYPPKSGGSVTTMKNLIDAFSPTSMPVATASLIQARPAPMRDDRDNVHHILTARDVYGRLDNLMRKTQVPLAARRLSALVRKTGARAILTNYPDVFFIDIALRASRKTGVPLVLYLHDTIAEALSRSPLRDYARNIQDQAFAHAELLYAQNDGMQAFYRDKYGLEMGILRHSYPEAIPTETATGGKRGGFWGGDVYDINRNALRRVYGAMVDNGIPLTTTSLDGVEGLVRKGFDRGHLEVGFIAAREDYIRALEAHRFLILSLDWPDESPVHEDELRTIFPGKTIEYLASGRPILIHCPEHYFLARFFAEHGCGELITDRDPAALSAAVKRLADDPDHAESMARKALVAAKLFARETVAAVLHRDLEALWT